MLCPMHLSPAYTVTVLPLLVKFQIISRFNPKMLQPISYRSLFNLAELIVTNKVVSVYTMSYWLHILESISLLVLSFYCAHWHPLCREGHPHLILFLPFFMSCYEEDTKSWSVYLSIISIVQKLPHRCLKLKETQSTTFL